MEKAKKYLWERIISNLKKDEKLKEMLKAFEDEKDLIEFVKFYCNLSFDNMKRVSSLGYYIRKQKYHYKEGRLLGNETKAMPDDIFFKLLDYVRNKWGEKIKLVLEFEGIEGPRGEDVVRIKLEDIDFKKHTVTIHNRKVNRIYEIPLNSELEKELKEFISQNQREIVLHKGFVFFSNNPHQKRDFISQKWLRNVVRKALDSLGLNKVYSKDVKGRKLHLYSLHSLRGHAATRVYNKTHDLKKVQELLDHSPKSTDTTMLYIERNKEDDLKGVI